MNARVQELAVQAKASVPPGLKVDEWIAEYNRIFAELIVRECANVAADHDALDIYEKIREHFGVER